MLDLSEAAWRQAALGIGAVCCKRETADDPADYVPFVHERNDAERNRLAVDREYNRKSKFCTIIIVCYNSAFLPDKCTACQVDPTGGCAPVIPPDEFRKIDSLLVHAK